MHDSGSSIPVPIYIIPPFKFHLTRSATNISGNRYIRTSKNNTEWISIHVIAKHRYIKRVEILNVSSSRIVVDTRKEGKRLIGKKKNLMDKNQWKSSIIYG